MLKSAVPNFYPKMHLKVYKEPFPEIRLVYDNEENINKIQSVFTLTRVQVRVRVMI